jgi:hypothetical protein
LFYFINVFRILIKAPDAFSVLRDASSTKGFMSRDFSEELDSLIDIANAVLENHEIEYGINELAIDPKGPESHLSILSTLRVSLSTIGSDLGGPIISILLTGSFVVILHSVRKVLSASKIDDVVSQWRENPIINAY